MTGINRREFIGGAATLAVGAKVVSGESPQDQTGKKARQIKWSLSPHILDKGGDFVFPWVLMINGFCFGCYKTHNEAVETMNRLNALSKVGGRCEGRLWEMTEKGVAHDKKERVEWAKSIKLKHAEEKVQRHLF